ncbi:MAG: haloacid dehalogenase-like hydrolase [Candidatus Omnitrophota bacterium]|jgi:phosphoserine phosphatase
MRQLIFNRPKAEVTARLSVVDIVCADLDECLFPFFVQIIVGISMFVEALIRPSLWIYLPHLSKAGVFIGMYKIKQLLFKLSFPHEILMDRYAVFMRGVPVAFIKRHSVYIHWFFIPGVLGYLKTFSDRGIPVVILSMSIQPILDVIREKVGFLARCVGNEVLVDKKDDTFSGYTQNRMVDGSDKLGKFKEIMRSYQAQHPLIIGHSRDEVPLVEYYSTLGGVSIGLNPRKEVASRFDVVLKAFVFRLD